MQCQFRFAWRSKVTSRCKSLISGVLGEHSSSLCNCTPSRTSTTLAALPEADLIQFPPVMITLTFTHLIKCGYCGSQLVHILPMHERFFPFHRTSTDLDIRPYDQAFSTIIFPHHRLAVPRADASGWSTSADRKPIKSPTGEILMHLPIHWKSGTFH